MNFQNAHIGSVRDNLKSPIHNWYKFTAGFSHRFVDEIIRSNKRGKTLDRGIFDPFAGCGTTLVSCQEAQLRAVGNEGQQFMYDVIRAKLNWSIDQNDFESCLALLKMSVTASRTAFDYKHDPHVLLKSLYDRKSLVTLYLIRDALDLLTGRKYRLFFKLALSQTLHRLSVHPIVPYICRTKTRSNPTPAWEVFENIARHMASDLSSCKRKKQTSVVYLHDSRKPNDKIEKNSCAISITSPPYLNNLDYGEVSKVHTHFFGYTSDWADITRKVRKRLVTGSTTHYRESEFDIDEFRRCDFYLNNKSLADRLIRTARQLRDISKERAGHKSFDILTLMYFSDMFKVLAETRRVVRAGGHAFLLIGDSAPYGVYIPTTRILGQIAKSVGFESFRIHRIRTRGTKWKLKYRHSLELPEGVLVLK